MTEQLLHRYFRNQITPAEAAQVLAWFDTEAGHAYLTQRLDHTLGAADWHDPPHAAAADPTLALAALRQRMEPVVVPFTPQRRPGWLTQPLRWAASFIGLLLLATGAFYAYQYRHPADLVQATPFGKTSRLTLPDGSVVTLNGNSRLRYAPRWTNGQTREVWLDGEGYFRVTHQPRHERFVVHLPNRLNIEVLGTQFNVLARKSRARVVLTNGKIRLDAGNQAKDKLVMQPGDLFFADVQTKVYYRKRVDPEVQSAWQAGKLRFDGTTLLEIAQMLEDTYGIGVVIANGSLQQQRISGSIPNTDLTTILNGLSTLFDLKITRQANRIIIQ